MRSTLMFCSTGELRASWGDFCWVFKANWTWPSSGSLLPELWPCLQSTGQTWAASSCGETLPGFSWVCILQVVFYPLENFYRTRETSGNKIMAIYIPFLPLISLPKTRKLMNFNRKPHQWKSARTHTREKGFLLAKMRNTFGRIRIPANRRLWRLHCGGCNCEWPFHFGGQCAKLKAYRKAFNLG